MPSELNMLKRLTKPAGSNGVTLECSDTCGEAQHGGSQTSAVKWSLLWLPAACCHVLSCYISKAPSVAETTICTLKELSCHICDVLAGSHGC